jgi:serine/threonine-protein kinase
VVAYRIFTGKRLFHGESIMQILMQICTAPLPSLRANAPWLPPATETWFMKACAREPQDRFASAQEFGEALKAACEGAVNISSPGLAQSNPGGNPMAYGQTSSVGAAASLGSVGSTSAAATASGMSRSGVGPDGIATPKSKAPVIAAVLATLVVVGGAAIVAVLTLSKKEPPPAAAAVAPTATPAVSEPAAHPMPTATLAEPAAAVAAVADAGHASEPHETAGGGTVATGSTGGPPAGGQATTHAGGGHAGAPPTGAPHPGTHPQAAPTGGAIDLGY